MNVSFLVVLKALIWTFMVLNDVSCKAQILFAPPHMRDIVCKHGNVVPHPTDCSSFIKCGFNDVDNVFLQCQYPTLYNFRTLDCDLPHRVTCYMYNFVPRAYVHRPELSSKGFSFRMFF